MAAQGPNILILMADQLAPQFLPSYGHPLVKTPNIQALAERGAVFDSAYCNAPLCAPARYVFMTGRLASKIAAWDNAAELSSEIPSYAHYLDHMGYETVLSGKMHFCGPDQLHGFGRRLTTDVYPADFSWTPNWDHPHRKLDWYHTMDVIKQAGPCIRSSYLDYDDEVAFSARRYLFDYVRGEQQRPFCMTVSFIHPHDPYISRPEYWNLYRPDDIDMPKLGFKEVDQDPHSKRLRHAIGADDYDPSEREIIAARRAYYASTSYIDEKMGEILTALEESGLRDNTWIIVTSDHGDMLGERGLWFKMNWFENSGRVPFIVAGPDSSQGRRIGQSVSHVDLLPTLVDIARDGRPFDYPTPLEGNSLLGHISGGSGGDQVIGEYFAECAEQPIMMIRRGPYKFVTSRADSDQLYDLVEDPLELRNLVSDGSSVDIVSAFRADAGNRWDVDGLLEQVLESQRRRQFLAPVMLEGGVSWDYQPRMDASSSYIRNTISIGEIEKRSRYPVFES